MSWRRFERADRGATAFWQLRVEGIRCFIGWGRIGGRAMATTVTLDDAQHARRHADRKIAAQLRKGYVEVPAPPEPGDDPHALVVDTIADARGKSAHGLSLPQYRPIDGFVDVVCRVDLFQRSPGGGFHRYLVLRDGGRSAIAFHVTESTHDPQAVAAFLELLVTMRDLPFDGASHHKLPLTRRAGRFTHALLCSPRLGRAASKYPTIASRVARALPVHDCEVGDADPEVLVDARLNGHHPLPYHDWSRAHHPVVDLRFDVAGPRRLTERTFKVYQPTDLHRLLSDLAVAGADSWVEVRSFRGDIRRITSTTLTPHTATEINEFLLDTAPGPASPEPRG